MSNFTFTKLVNWVFTTLRDATAGGGTLAYVKRENVLLGMHHDLKNLNKRTPVIQVFKQIPTSRAETWPYVANNVERADVLLRIELGIHPEDPAWPYGYYDADPTKQKRGWDTFCDDVLNTIEAAPNGQTLGGNVVDAKLSVMDEDVVNDLYVGAIEVRCYLEFAYAGR